MKVRFEPFWGEKGFFCRKVRNLPAYPYNPLPVWSVANKLIFSLAKSKELESALSLIQSSANKPKGTIRVSTPPYFGRHYLTPITMKFLSDFPDIKIDLVLSNNQLDPIKEQLDLVIRGAGFISEPQLQDSSMQMKLLLKDKIGLYSCLMSFRYFR